MPIARPVLAAGLAAVLATAPLAPLAAQTGQTPPPAPQMSVDVITQGAAAPAAHGFVVPAMMLMLTLAVIANSGSPHNVCIAGASAALC